MSPATPAPSSACVHTAGLCQVCRIGRNVGAVAALSIARSLVADDSLAMSSLTLGAYRTQLLQLLGELLLEAGAPDFIAEQPTVDP